MPRRRFSAACRSRARKSPRFPSTNTWSSTTSSRPPWSGCGASSPPSAPGWTGCVRTSKGSAGHFYDRSQQAPQFLRVRRDRRRARAAASGRVDPARRGRRAQEDRRRPARSGHQGRREDFLRFERVDMALVALGVTGGIGAYKAVEVARGLQKRGHEVVAVMTHSATRFVGPITFEAITRRHVITDQFAAGMNADIEHVALASTIDLLLVAPATANVVGKFAHGIADDFLSTLYIATRAPVLLAPAMNTQMFEHVAVRKNLDTLASRGVRFVEPGEGYLACGWIGKGRLAEPEQIVEAAESILHPSGALRNRRVLVTAGPTYEDLDPVRYIGNRSSGKMGVAIAAEAARRGAAVTLVAGPASIEAPTVAELVRVRSAAEMHHAVMTRAGEMQVAVMAAAVADYAPADRAAQKVPKDGETVTLVLKRTPDILGDLGQRRLASGAGPVLVGFAAETEDVVTGATAKGGGQHEEQMLAKEVSRTDAGFDVDANEVTIVGAAGAEALPLQSKARVAAQILDRVEKLLSGSRSTHRTSEIRG